MKPNNWMFIGITGGVGAGKSQVLDYIGRHYKCEIYLADEVAHIVKLPGTKCFDELVKILGNDVLTQDGDIDKAVMAAKIFADNELLDRVNNIIHPAVREFLLDKLEQAKHNDEIELFFVEAALLIEGGYKELVDEMWYVYADEDTRSKRLKASRGYTDEKIKNIMGNQLSENEFRLSCDFVLDNSGDIQDTYRQIDKKLEAFTWQM